MSENYITNTEGKIQVFLGGKEVVPEYTLGSLEDLSELGHSAFSAMGDDGSFKMSFLIDFLYVGVSHYDGVEREMVRKIPLGQMKNVLSLFSQIATEFSEWAGEGE